MKRASGFRRYDYPGGVDSFTGSCCTSPGAGKVLAEIQKRISDRMEECVMEKVQLIGRNFYAQ